MRWMLLALLLLPGCALFRSPPGPTPPVLCQEPTAEAWRDIATMREGGPGRSWVVNVYEHPCKQNAEIRQHLGYPVPAGMVK